MSWVVFTAVFELPQALSARQLNFVKRARSFRVRTPLAREGAVCPLRSIPIDILAIAIALAHQSFLTECNLP